MKCYFFIKLLLLYYLCHDLNLTCHPLRSLDWISSHNVNNISSVLAWSSYLQQVCHYRDLRGEVTISVMVACLLLNFVFHCFPVHIVTLDSLSHSFLFSFNGGYILPRYIRAISIAQRIVTLLWEDRRFFEVIGRDMFGTAVTTLITRLKWMVS